MSLVVGITILTERRQKMEKEKTEFTTIAVPTTVRDILRFEAEERGVKLYRLVESIIAEWMETEQNKQEGRER